MNNFLDFSKRLVVTRDEGSRAGMTNGVLVDETIGRISAILMQRRRWGNEQWVRTSDVVSVGPTVVVISSNSKVHESGSIGRRLDDFRGRWVTTLGGTHLGRLAKVGADNADWGLRMLEFQDGSKVLVDGKQLVFGRDEILVPNELTDRIRKSTQVGSLTEVWRWVRRHIPGTQEAPPTTAQATVTDAKASNGDADSKEPGAPIFGPALPGTHDRDDRREGSRS